MKVLGRKNSSNVQKVLWTLEEIGLDYEREDYGGPFGKVQDADYKAINPNAVVPTIVDGDFVLWESNACVRYLSEKYSAGVLSPQRLEDRADADRWMDWQQTTVAGPITPVFWGLIRQSPDERDNDAIAAARDLLEEKMAILDRHLESRAFVTGDNFTMGDIPLGIMAYRWFSMDIKRRDLPALRAWYDRLDGRPAFAKTVAIGLT